MAAVEQLFFYVFLLSGASPILFNILASKNLKSLSKCTQRRNKIQKLFYLNGFLNNDCQKKHKNTAFTLVDPLKYQVPEIFSSTSSNQVLF